MQLQIKGKSLLFVKANGIGTYPETAELIRIRIEEGVQRVEIVVIMGVETVVMLIVVGVVTMPKIMQVKMESIMEIKDLTDLYQTEVFRMITIKNHRSF